jgi:ornithine cyclodeaminase/alanine dehydrogenase-like protein (mu-crystallin family)
VISMREFNDLDVIAAIDPVRLIDEVGLCLADLGNGLASQMSKATLPIAGGGFFLSVAAVVPRLGLAASKWASYLPGDAGAPGVSTSRITVSDATTGEALALVDGMVATQLRTAATAVSVAHRFGAREPGAVAFLGFGPTNRAVFDLLGRLQWAPSSIRIAVRSAASRDAVAAAFAHLPQIMVTVDAAAAVAGADLAFSGTGASTPVARVEALAPGAVVVSLDGSDTWASGPHTIVVDDRTRPDGSSPVAAAFALGTELRGDLSQRLLADVAGSAVTDVALAALLLDDASWVST